MKPRSPQSMQLYKMLLSRGYPESFCDLVTKNLNTDFTASRMIGYLCHYSDLPPEEIADEMLAILSDRNRIMQKKELESNNAEWNRILMQGLGIDTEQNDDGDMELKFQKKKYKSKGFAAGGSSEVIERVAEQLGWDVEKIVRYQ